MTEPAQPPVGRPKESFLSIWSRRALSLPLYAALALLCFVGAPVWLLWTAATDVVGDRGRSWPRTRALGFFGLYLACEVAGVALATLLWIATPGGRIGGPLRYLDANAALQRWWTAALFKGSVWLFSMKVHVEGLELARSGPLLLFVRHASTADTVLATAFVDRTGSRSRAEIDAVSRLGKDLDARSAVLIYPEGTRFTAEKLAHGIEALRERKQERLAAIASGFRHVLPPRLGGPLALLEAAPGVDLLLLEHTGFEGTGTFTRFWSGGLVGQLLRVRLRRFAANTIPASGRDEWLFERWAEMDDWIAPSSAAEAHSP